jgi:hypothetical protein
VLQVRSEGLFPKAKGFGPKPFVDRSLSASESAEAMFTVTWAETAYHAIWHFIIAIFHLSFEFQGWS